ncbi:PAS domain-containing protein [Sneathiella sp.]|uniref:PAS domain-containing protein n=1 Tax=Sneathiella sp. TaxID=1964365 RepID=UPI003563E32E
MAGKTFDQIDWGTEDAKEFADYWQSLSDKGPVPRKSHFDPTKIVSLLPFIAIYDVVSPDEIVCRLAGTALVEHFGQEVTGRNLLDFYQPGIREETGRIMDEMTTEPCGIIVELVGTARSGRTASSLAIGFPLLDDDDQCNRLVFYSSRFEGSLPYNSREDAIQALNVGRSTTIDISA